MIRNLFILTFVVAAVAGDLLSHDSSRSFHPQQTKFSAPAQSYDAPAPSYTPLASSYTAPAPNPSAPGQCYPQTETEYHTQIKQVRNVVS